MTPPAATPRLALSGISKVYPGVIANDCVDLEVLPGEIHAVLGENGAGKSTLMKIIYGVVRPDAGVIRWNGRRSVAIAGPGGARRLGIGMVFQHFSLFETLTVAENIARPRQPAPWHGDSRARIRDVAARLRPAVDPQRPVHAMSVGERQRVEIVRCLLHDPRSCSSSTSRPRCSRRRRSTRCSRPCASSPAEGCCILYISHKLDEIRSLCHRCTVLRAGKVTGSCDPTRGNRRQRWRE